MAWYEPSRIIALFKSTVYPRVMDGTVNRTLLGIAQRGYWVQSRLLRVPDRFGFFSSGPPLLQAHQGNELAMILVDVVASVSAAIILVWFWWDVDTPWWFPIIVVEDILLSTVPVYVMEVFFNPMRAPNYDWTALSQELGASQALAPASALDAGSGTGTVVREKAPKVVTECSRI